MKKGCILLILILFVIIVFAVVGLINSGNPDITDQKAEYQISAIELFSEFEYNETLANKKYLDKVVQINGYIGEVIINQENEVILILKKNTEIFGINCRVPDDKTRKNHYLVGNYIEVKGIVQGFLDDVIVTNCVIVNYSAK